MKARPDPEAAGLRRLLTRAALRTALPYVVVGILVAVGVFVVGWEVDHNVDAIEAWIGQLGTWGLLAFVVVFMLGSTLLVPDTVLCLLAGALFGTVWGATAVVVGALLGSMLQFLLAHRFLRGRIERALTKRPALARIQRAVKQDELRLQVLLRLTPLNPATVSYLLGAAGVRFKGFVVTSLVHVPVLIIEVYFGNAGKHMARMAGANTQNDRLHLLTLLGGVAVCVVVLILVSKMARRALVRAVEEDDAAHFVRRT